jgi:hypothetical protein
MVSSLQVPEFQETSLVILANDEAFSGAYNELEVWRSPAPGQPFKEITGEAWTAARVPADGEDEPPIVVAGPLIDVVGQRLSVIARNGDLSQLDFDFVGAGAALLKDIAIQITSQSGGRLKSYVDTNQKLVLETTVAGASSYLQVLSTTAAVFLGLPTELPESEAFGKERRIPLQPGVSQYTFVDQAGSPTSSYKTRFRNSVSGVTSEFSLPFTGVQAIGLNPTRLITGFLSLVGNDGKPLAFTEVSIRSNFRGQLVDGKLIAGGDLVDSTNSEGYVEFVLVRGQPYTLGIAGTNIVKDFTAPTDSSLSTFPLLDPAYGTADDYFKVRVPNIPTLARGSI